MFKIASSSSRKIKKAVSLFLVLTIALSMVPVFGVQTVSAASPYLLSLNRPAYASSINGNNTPNLAVDGDDTTRWDSQWGTDPQWLYIDLGATASITSATIKWENAYAKAYRIEISNDELNWSTIHTNNNGVGGTETLNITGTGRYVRLYCTQRALTPYGYSLFEFQIYGTGGANPPPADYGPNIALNKVTAASSVQTDWYIKPGETDAKNAVDGNRKTRWGSNASDPQWIYVDLGSTHTIGRVILDWEVAAARTFDLQVSNDAQNWTTVYRDLRGIGGKQNIPLYATGRYVRMYGISRATTFGYSLYEFEIYDYINGDPQPTYTISPLPTPATVNVGAGSYLTNDITLPQPKLPNYKSSNINAPIPSNDWWQSLLINHLGNGIVTLPLKSKFTSLGLSILNPGAGYADGSSINAQGNPDLYLIANNISTSTMETRITGYGDWSADAVLSDDSTDKMKVTFVKGSPYIFTTFSDPNTPEIYSAVITRFFDDNNNEILTTDGASVTADHIGIEITNKDSAPTPQTFVRPYGVFAPQGTVFTRVGNKVKIKLGDGKNYLSLAALPSVSNLNFFYRHAYAFVTGTTVGYSFDPASSQVTTNFNLTTTLKRTDLEANTLTCLLPHQWKISPATLTTLTYPSVRGTLKVVDGNSFTTVDRFYGILPQFTEPKDSGYSRAQLQSYLDIFDQQVSTNYMSADPYWQGKALHPLAMAVITADLIGNTTARDKYLGIIRTILTDWFTYTQGEPNYFFYYNDEWGTMIYKNSEFGANTGITDHHFTYGYYMFAASVLASYDSTFLANYKGMIEMLVRDYANPSRTDSMYPFFRNFDPYEGHSWAGGYGDNDSGNNQEAAGESLFGWVGLYMWGMVTGNNTYRDAGIYGFTTEEKAIEQYWFNYDNDNWVTGYNHGIAGQVYGSAYLYGTFFSGDPVCIYGIHWLPTAEYLTYYGRYPAKAGNLYNAFLKDKGKTEDSWYHIIWPFQALSDPQGALAKWDANVANMQQNEVFNTYWFVHNMATLGQRSMDIWATNWTGYSVFKNGTNYTALVWNPTNAAVNVTFRNAAGTLGTVVVPAKATISVDPSNPVLPVAAPAFTPAGGTYTSAQRVTLSCATSGATIKYTTDGSTPNAGSATYTGPIDVTATTTIKAYAVKSGMVDSAVSTATYTVTIPSGGAAIPGKIEAENYNAMSGVQAEACSEDTQDVGWIDTGDWMDYNVNVQTAGAYTVEYRISSPYATGQIQLKNGTTVLATTNVPNTGGWQNWQTITATVNLSAGAQTLRLNAGVGGWNINWVNFTDSTAQVATPVITPATGTYASAQSVTITSGTSGATIRYTTDGSTPTATTGTVYTGAFTVSSTKTVKAIAYKSGMTDSGIAASTITISANPVNLALNKPATASSYEAVFTANAAVDGDAGTRWSSAFSDPQWIYVDLGSVRAISRVKLSWETAYGKGYSIQVSNDAANWTQVYSTTTGDGGSDDVPFTATNARYVRMYGTQRSTEWGYSLYEFEVYE